MVVRLSEGEEIVPTQRSVMETFPALTDVLFGVVRVLEAPRQDDLVEELLITRGGRFYCDNVDLASPAGWAVFEESRLGFKPNERPSQISKCSTKPEIETFLKRAGFADVRVDGRLDFWVYGWGSKP